MSIKSPEGVLLSVDDPGNPASAQAEYNASSLYGGLGRSLTRALALYFARPVRLFRPSKVSGWMTLKNTAMQSNATLSPEYISLLIRKEGFHVIPRHFLPPLIVNSILGALLFETFTYSNSYFHNHYPTNPSIVSAAASGAMAGCVHAIAGAPADNVRLILEGGYRTQIQTAQSVTGWREAWKEVFREVQHVEPVRDSIGRAAGVQIGGPRTRKEAREFRAWMKEIKGMSRGWEGLGWGCGKDMFGFAIFFAVFDATRQIASSVVRFFDPTITDYNAEVTQSKNNAARIGQSVVLVTGGVAAGFGYEFAARPFDNARRIVYEHRMELPKDTGSLSKVALPMKSATAKSHILLTHLKENGFASLFRLPGTVVQEDQATHFRRTKMFLRVLGRLGPWGVGFLMWEGMGYR